LSQKTNHLILAITLASEDQFIKSFTGKLPQTVIRPQARQRVLRGIWGQNVSQKLKHFGCSQIPCVTVKLRARSTR